MATSSPSSCRRWPIGRSPSRSPSASAAAFEAGIIVDGKEIFVGASIGIAFADGSDHADPAVGHDDLVRNADVAMYTAKSRGKRRFEVYEPGMHSAVLNRLQLKADLQRGLDHDEFVLHFQPIISVDDGAA